MYYTFKSYPKTHAGMVKRKQVLVNLGDKAEKSTRGRLVQLLPKIEDAELQRDIEETLKKMP
jgi:hypothetical protein